MGVQPSMSATLTPWILVLPLSESAGILSEWTEFVLTHNRRYNLLPASTAVTACGGTRSGAAAARTPRVRTGRVKRVPAKQEPDGKPRIPVRGKAEQLCVGSRPAPSDARERVR